MKKSETNEKTDKDYLVWNEEKAFQHVDGTLIYILISTSPLTINSRFDFFSLLCLVIRFVSGFHVFSWGVRGTRIFETNSIGVRKTTSSLDV